MPSTLATPLRKLSPEQRVARSLSSALLLAFTGGFLDAFLYVAHGRVFAGAMSGNAVLAGIALFSHNRHDTLQHLLPIAAFALGILAAFIVESRLMRHTVLIGLGLEATGLFIASWLPRSFPDTLFVPLICSVAGYQIASFRTVDTFAYNATFIAGNLRSTIESLHTLLRRNTNRETRRNSLREFRDLGLVLVLFTLGAVGSALLTPRLGNHALWIPLAAVLAVLSIALERDLHPPHTTNR